MLKVAVVQMEPGAVGTSISMNYMEVARWSLHVKRIIRREDVRTYFERAFAAKLPSVTWKTRVTMSYEILLGIFVCLCLLIGLGEVVGWVWHLLF
jgi:hypothetical protein